METQAIYTGKFNGKVYGAGDIVKITYDGTIRESYPAQLGTVYRIQSSK